MPKAVGLAIALFLPMTARAQTPPPAESPVATDVTAADIRAFIDALPRDPVSDLPIRVGELETDIEYLLFRPDPDNRMRLR